MRSSATAEDLADASFAGQLNTLLHIEGDEELVAAIEKCWASLDSERAVAYRKAYATDPDAIGMAVVVQRMVQPRAAGVMFTANPITGTRSEIVIDAVPGLGTGVVDGSMPADHFVLRRGEPPKGHGCLSARDLVELSQVGQRLEKLFGKATGCGMGVRRRRHPLVAAISTYHDLVSHSFLDRLRRPSGLSGDGPHAGNAQPDHADGNLRTQGRLR